MKILITGGTGQIGYELQRSLNSYGVVDAPNREKLDLEDFDAVKNYLRQTTPDLIVNAAAWTAVDEAEEEWGKCNILNVALPELLANYAAGQNKWLIHYSSDYVYSGDGEQPWTEESPTKPLSVYGKSKSEGDQKIIASGANFLIFRTSWVYSARGNNFMKTMLNLAEESIELAIVADQVGAPTPARLVANITALAVTKIQNGKRLDKGIYHLSPRGLTNWCEFAKLIFRLARKEGKELKIAKVRPIKTEQYPTPATRPLNSRLSLHKLEAELSIEMPSWEDQLELTFIEFAR